MKKERRHQSFSSYIVDGGTGIKEERQEDATKFLLNFAWGIVYNSFVKKISLL